MTRSKPTEGSTVAESTALLLRLSEEGLRRVQAEINTALSTYNRK